MNDSQALRMWEEYLFSLYDQQQQEAIDDEDEEVVMTEDALRKQILGTARIHTRLINLLMVTYENIIS